MKNKFFAALYEACTAVHKCAGKAKKNATRMFLYFKVTLLLFFRIFFVVVLKNFSPGYISSELSRARRISLWKFGQPRIYTSKHTYNIYVYASSYLYWSITKPRRGRCCRQTYSIIAHGPEVPQKHINEETSLFLERILTQTTSYEETAMTKLFIKTFSVFQKFKTF